MIYPWDCFPLVAIPSVLPAVLAKIGGALSDQPINPCEPVVTSRIQFTNQAAGKGRHQNLFRRVHDHT